jgi:uncharacterized protein YjlB
MNTASDEGARVVAHHLEPAGAIPNHPHWPLLLYPRAVAIEGADPAARFEELFGRNRWPAAWRNGIFPFHHFHTNAHEVLGVYSGEVTVLFGGEGGVLLTAQPGDVIILPAGTGHKRMSLRGVLGIVGAYPAGQAPNMRTPLLSSLAGSAKDVVRVPLPELDPVYGRAGQLFLHWT